MSTAKRIWRAVLAIPGSVLLVCLFLPALRVCDAPAAPVSFPPCWGAYLGGFGVILMVLGRAPRVRAIGAAITPVLAVVTVGGCTTLAVGDWAGRYDKVFELEAIAVGALTLGIAAAIIRAFLRRPPQAQAMAIVTILQGLASTIWSTILLLDPEALWGAYLTLAAGLALAIGGLVWHAAALAAQQPPPVVEVPTAIAIKAGRPAP